MAAELGIPAISTGDIFRTNVAEGTELGVKVSEILDSGGYVPDGLTNDLVRDRLGAGDARAGFLLDGYPRTQAQVDELDAILAADSRRLDRVLELTVEVDVLVARLLRRAETGGRSDDTEDVVRKRQQLYAEQTAPLTEVYSGRGLLVRVDGTGEVDVVTARLLSALQ
jgi:adenylate kinase